MFFPSKDQRGERWKCGVELEGVPEADQTAKRQAAPSPGSAILWIWTDSWLAAMAEPIYSEGPVDGDKSIIMMYGVQRTQGVLLVRTEYYGVRRAHSTLQ